MAPELYAHPFSSYCQKVLTALYENGTEFTFRMLNFGKEDATVMEWARLWPMRRMPVLVDDGTPVMESTVIIEHLDLHHPGQSPLLPVDRKAALEVRMVDRVLDNYVQTQMQKIVFDAMRPEGERDPAGVAQARGMLDTAYAWLDDRMAGREWAAGGTFGLADCAAAPALFYADWAHPIPERHGHLRGYRTRLLARPSFARAVNEARPYRGFFPLGAPDRD